DVRTPPEKTPILERYEREAEKAETQFKRGIITDDERRQKEIEIWTSANSEVGRAMERTLSTMAFNPLDMMVDSGARGNSQQVRQIAGMKGLVSNPRGEMINRPIKSSFRERRSSGRVRAEDLTLSDGTTLKGGLVVGDEDLARLRDDPDVTRVRVRSVLTCEAEHGVCAACYGQSLASGRQIEMGEAVGVI